MCTLDLKVVHTKVLLKLYRNLKAERSEFINYMCEEDEIDEATLAQLTKHLKAMKKELDGRENILTKQEKKAKRQLLAKKNKGGRRSHKN